MLDYDNERSSYYKVCRLDALGKNSAALVGFFYRNLLTLRGNKTFTWLWNSILGSQGKILVY